MGAWVHCLPAFQQSLEEGEGFCPKSDDGAEGRVM